MRLSALSIILLFLFSGATFAQSFGAIAYSPANDRWGWSRDYTNRAQAERRATQECRSAGGSNCRVAVWFQNGCGALATGRSGWGSGWGTRQSRADSEAIQVCRGHTGNCRVRLQVCTPS